MVIDLKEIKLMSDDKTTVEKDLPKSDELSTADCQDGVCHIKF